MAGAPCHTPAQNPPTSPSEWPLDRIQFLTMACVACSGHLQPHLLLTSRCALCSGHAGLLLSLEHVQHVVASGPLHMLPTQPETCFLWPSTVAPQALPVRSLLLSSEAYHCRVTVSFFVVYLPPLGGSSVRTFSSLPFGSLAHRSPTPPLTNLPCPPESSASGPNVDSNFPSPSQLLPQRLHRGAY